MPSFHLVHVSGDDLGVMRLGDVTCQPGDTIPLGRDGELHVVEVEWNDEDDEVAGTLTVDVVGF